MAEDLRAQIDEVGKRTERRFDPGVRAVLIAVGVLVLLLAAALPWADGATGWQVLLGHRTGSKLGGVAPRLFLTVALVFGVLGSIGALAVRRYGAAWLCSLGIDASVLIGALSIWSQQTTASHHPGPGPGGGLLLAFVGLLFLAILWAGIVWAKPPQQETGQPTAEPPAGSSADSSPEPS